MRRLALAGAAAGLGASPAAAQVSMQGCGTVYDAFLVGTPQRLLDEPVASGGVYSVAATNTTDRLFACKSYARLCAGDGSDLPNPPSPAACTDVGLLGCFTYVYDVAFSLDDRAVYAGCGAPDHAVTRCDWDPAAGVASNCAVVADAKCPGAGAEHGVLIHPSDGTKLVVSCQSSAPAESGIVVCTLAAPGGGTVAPGVGCARVGDDPCGVGGYSNWAIALDSAGKLAVGCRRAPSYAYCDFSVTAGASNCGTSLGSTACPTGFGTDGSYGIAELPTGRTAVCCGSDKYGACGAVKPTAGPAAGPTAAPTALPSAAPSVQPTRSPIQGPTASPVLGPSAAPSITPSTAPAAPSPSPSAVPTGAPIINPTAGPSASPKAGPTGVPVIAPSAAPSGSPSPAPTGVPIIFPTAGPSTRPSAAPTGGPVIVPSAAPSMRPSAQPSAGPLPPPTAPPSAPPSAHPSAPPRPPTAPPTGQPSTPPSAAPSNPPTPSPSAEPSLPPSSGPSSAPSAAPSPAPSQAPSLSPSSAAPTHAPSAPPSQGPSRSPSQSPSRSPSAAPTEVPSPAPTAAPSPGPSAAPSAAPSAPPTAAQPSTAPTAAPSPWPSATPTPAPHAPSEAPTPRPAPQPSGQPSPAPSAPPSGPAPSPGPTRRPSARPSVPPSAFPSRSPAAAPSPAPSGGHSGSAPSRAPSALPTLAPTLGPSPRPPPPRAALGIALAGGGAAAAASIGAAAGAGGSMGALAMADTSCETIGTMRDLSRALHPTALSVGGSSYVGCLVGGLLIVSGTAALSFAALGLVSGAGSGGDGLLRRKDIEASWLRHVPVIKKSEAIEPAAALRHPNTIFVVSLFLYQGGTLSALRLAVATRDPNGGAEPLWYHVVGVVAAAALLFVPWAVYRPVSRGVRALPRSDLPAEAGPQPRARVRPWDAPAPPLLLRRLLLSTHGDWVSCRRRRHWISRWQSAVRHFRAPHAAPGLAFELTCMWFLSLANAFSTPSFRACGHVRAASAAVHGMQLLYCGGLRPYRCARDDISKGLAQGLMTAANINLAAVFYRAADAEERGQTPRPDEGTEPSVVLLQVATYVVLVQVGLRMLAEACLFAKGWRAHSQALEWAENDPELEQELRELPPPGSPGDDSLKWPPLPPASLPHIEPPPEPPGLGPRQRSAGGTARLLSPGRRSRATERPMQRYRSSGQAPAVGSRSRRPPPSPVSASFVAAPSYGVERSTSSCSLGATFPQQRTRYRRRDSSRQHRAAEKSFALTVPLRARDISTAQVPPACTSVRGSSPSGLPTLRRASRRDPSQLLLGALLSVAGSSEAPAETPPPASVSQRSQRRPDSLYDVLDEV